MITALTEVVEGWTGALPFTLKADGDPVNLTGLTVSIVLRDARGATILDTSSSGSVSVTGATDGEVEYLPSSSHFVARWTPYRLRFRVTDTSRVVYFPNEDEDVIKVNVV